MKHFITLTLLLLLTTTTWSQDTWVKVIGGRGEDRGRSITATSDGGFLIAGTSSSEDGDFKGMNKGGNDVFVIKLDKNGKLVWKKNYGGSDNDHDPFIISTLDDGIVITGETSSHDGDFKGGKQVDGYDPDIFIMKLDNDGEILWTKTFGGTHIESGPIISTTSNGDILITGNTSSEDGDFKGMNKGGEEIFIIKIDKDGKTLWKKTIGGSYSESVTWINTTSNGDVLITGTFSSNDGDFKGQKKSVSNNDHPELTADKFISKIDKDGNVLWTKTVVRDGEDGGWSMSSMTLTSDDGAVIVGYTQDGDDFGIDDVVDLVVIKLDKNGDVLWNDVYGVSDHWNYSNHVRCTSDDGILIVGVLSKPFVKTDNYGNTEVSSMDDILLFKLDKDGDKLWDRSFGGKGNNEGGRSITTTPDGDIVITGTTDSNDGDFKRMNKGYYDIFIMKLDKDGNLKSPKK